MVRGEVYEGLGEQAGGVELWEVEDLGWVRLIRPIGVLEEEERSFAESYGG